MRPKILLVEDDASLVELVSYNLEREGFDVVCTGDGEEALVLAQEEKPDLIILDWMIANLSGIEVCRRLRRAPATANLPIVMLTARAEEADRIRGLETGADDYVTKPFSPRELVARLRALLRRLRPALSGGNLEHAGIVMDTSAHRVVRDGRTVQLGPTEFRLLRHFLEHPSRVFSREQLLDLTSGRSAQVFDRTIDNQISRLRRKIERDPARPALIATVWGGGYSLAADVREASG